MGLIKLAGPISAAFKDLGKAIKKSMAPKSERVKDIVKKNVDKAKAAASGEALAGQKAQADFYNKKIKKLKIGLGAIGVAGVGAGIGGKELYDRNKKEK